MLFDEDEGFEIKFLNAFVNLIFFEFWILVGEIKILTPVTKVGANDEQISVIFKIRFKDFGICLHLCFVNLTHH